MAINEEDILSYNFFQYGTPFFGSFHKKNYRIARNPLKNVFFDSDPHKNDDAQFEVTLWEGMENFDTTKAEKITQYFPFTPEGRLLAIAWLDTQCADKPGITGSPDMAAPSGMPALTDTADPSGIAAPTDMASLSDGEKIEKISSQL